MITCLHNSADSTEQKGDPTSLEDSIIIHSTVITNFHHIFCNAIKRFYALQNIFHKNKIIHIHTNANKVYFFVDCFKAVIFCCKIIDFFPFFSFLFSSICIKRKYWIRENFRHPVFGGFTCFEMS